MSDFRDFASKFSEALNHSKPLAAAKEILDRAYGKCAQPISGDGGGSTILRAITGVQGPALSVLVRLKRRAKVGPKVGPVKRIEMKS